MESFLFILATPEDFKVEFLCTYAFMYLCIHCGTLLSWHVCEDFETFMSSLLTRTWFSFMFMQEKEILNSFSDGSVWSAMKLENWLAFCLLQSCWPEGWFVYKLDGVWGKTVRFTAVIWRHLFSVPQKITLSSRNTTISIIQIYSRVDWRVIRKASS